MAADKYILRITAGSDYDPSTHVQVPVNEPSPVAISGPHAAIQLNVRVHNYAGLPPNSPATSPYFAAEPHATNQDQYSIAFRFTPTTRRQAPGGAAGISGTDLQFGNDFDRPIRDRLPPGFNTALRIVKWWIDPGLDGDAYADRPHLYGPALSSFNVLEMGEGAHDPARGGLWFDEGGADEARARLKMPATGKARMKWALADANKEQFLFEYGKTYGFDFFNPYLDFANLALRLPGFQLSIANYWDGQALRSSNNRRLHQLRYVLRNRTTGDVYLVVVFSLFLRKDLNEDGTLKEGAQQLTAGGAADATATKPAGGEEHSHDHDEEAAMKQAQDKFGVPPYETSADDVD